MNMLIYYGCVLGFACVGAYLLVHNHPIAGGWLVTGAIVALLFTSWKSSGDDK